MQVVDGIEARDLHHGDADDGEGGVTVMLAGGHVPTLQSVRVGLERHGFSVVAEAADAAEAIRAARRWQPQVCLLDIDTPGGGILAADRINREAPDTKIALLADSMHESELCDAILAGADGYLFRNIAPEPLTAAVRGLVNGEAALPRALTGHLVREYRDSVRPPARQTAFSRDVDSGPLPPYSRVSYLPRFVRHFIRRRRSGMSFGTSWTSARKRMHDYA